MTDAHRPSIERISALAGGELEAAEAAAVQAAIDIDEGLQADYQSLVAAAELLAQSPTLRAPRSYVASLPPATVASWWARWAPALLATAAAALIAFALVDVQGLRYGRSEPTSVAIESQLAVAATTAMLPESSLDEAGISASEIEAAVMAESEMAAAAPAAAPDATIAAVAGVSTDASAPSSEIAIEPISVVPDPEPSFDPVIFAALITGGMLLIAAGFVYVFRPR